MPLDFNPSFSTDMRDTLNDRVNAVANRRSKWNYKKYAWVNISTTGKTKSVLCVSKMSVGDKNAPSGGGLSLYKNEGSIRKHIPTLNSVNISNNANGGDYVDAYLYEVEASFKVFTLADLDRVEKSFFRIGAEMKVQFGWRNQENQGDGGNVFANIYNFSYSIDSDGGYNCQVKAISPAALWQSDELAGTNVPTTTFSSDQSEIVGYFDDLNLQFKQAVGVNPSETLEEKGQSNGTDVGQMSKIYPLDSNWQPRFFYTRLNVKEGGFLSFDEDSYIKYMTIGTLVRYINEKQKPSEFKYEIAPQESVGGNFPNLVEIGSADPTKFILPGKQANYGDPGRTDVSELMSQWGGILNDSIDNGNDNKGSRIASIAVSLEYCNTIYTDLAKSAKSKGGIKQSPKIGDFFGKLFEDLEYLTGGLVSLSFIPIDKAGNIFTQLSTSNGGSDDINKQLLINRKNVTNRVSFNSSDKYTFQTLNSGSILKSVSLESNFDSDYIVMATRKSTQRSSNYDKVVQLFDCDSNDTVVSDEPDVEESEALPTQAQQNNNSYDASYGENNNTQQDALSTTGFNQEVGVQLLQPNSELRELQLMRYKFSELGIESFSVSGYAEACKNYIYKNANDGSNSEISKSRYSEILFTLDLSVTIDGIWGIELLSPISIDRLPTSFKKEGIKFSIIAIDHTFDGQGGWETSLKTVMRIM
jgi:hypothetical protein